MVPMILHAFTSDCPSKQFKLHNDIGLVVSHQFTGLAGIERDRSRNLSAHLFKVADTVTRTDPSIISRPSPRTILRPASS